VETIAAVGEPTPPYLTAWFLAGRDGDGVARWWSAPRQMSPGVLHVVGPDGRGIVVVVDDAAVESDGLGHPEDVARTIADSVAPATAEQLSALWDGLVEQWAARDLQVAVPTPAGTVELRGTGPDTVLCLRTDGELTCGPADHPDLNEPPEPGGFDGQWAVTVPTADGDQLVAVSDRGPILIELQTIDVDDPDGVVFAYPQSEHGEADGSWAAVFPTGDDQFPTALTDVDREAEACLDMLGSDLAPGGARPDEEQRIRDEGGSPATMYEACRDLVAGSYYRDIGP